MKLLDYFFILLVSMACLILILAKSEFDKQEIILKINENIEEQNQIDIRQDNGYYVCPICESDSVYEEVWLNPNNGESITMYEDTCYCMHCKKHIPNLKLIDND